MPSEHTPSLVDGYADTPKGRTPNDADQAYGTSRSLEATYDDRSTIKRIEDGVHSSLTDSKVLLGSAAVAAGNLYELQYNLVDVPGINEHPEALAAAAGLGGAVVFYNAARRAADGAYSAIVPRTTEAVNRLRGKETADVDPLLAGIEDYEDLEALLDGDEVAAHTPVCTDADPSEAEFYTSRDELDSDEGWVRDGWGRADVNDDGPTDVSVVTETIDGEAVVADPDPEDGEVVAQTAPTDGADDHGDLDYSDDEIEQAMEDATEDLDPDRYQEMAEEVEAELEEAASDADEDEEQA